MDETDARDIAASLAGDETAFGALVARYENRVGRLMWRFTRNHDERLALVQDVFVETFFSLRNFRGDGSFWSWLQKIAIRVGYAYWRRRARSRSQLPVIEADGTEPKAHEVTSEQAADILHALLERLPPDDRLVLTLHYFEQYSMKQISEQTGWSPDAVKVRAMRARKRLKAIAEREHVLEALGWTR